MLSFNASHSVLEAYLFSIFTCLKSTLIMNANLIPQLVSNNAQELKYVDLIQLKELLNGELIGHQVLVFRIG
jgi:hypothetical protein